jgi:hypothetical protein
MRLSTNSCSPTVSGATKSSLTRALVPSVTRLIASNEFDALLPTTNHHPSVFVPGNSGAHTTVRPFCLWEKKKKKKKT